MRHTFDVSAGGTDRNGRRCSGMPGAPVTPSANAGSMAPSGVEMPALLTATTTPAAAVDGADHLVR